MTKGGRLGFLLLVCACLIASPLSLCAADTPQTSEPEPTIIDTLADDAPVVRVGYYETSGYMSRGRSGDYVGYYSEYLQEIAKYTDWNYEIVECIGPEQAADKLAAGEIDLLPGVQASPELEKTAAYPELPLCYAYTTLYVRGQDDRYPYEDFDAFSSMRIGVIRGSHEEESLTAYCRANQIGATILPYDRLDSMRNALAGGSLDGIATVQQGRDCRYKIVAQFSPKPRYVVTAKSNAVLTARLDEAIRTLSLRNPGYEAYLYDKYFSVSPSQHPSFTKDELAYIQNCGELTAVYDPLWAPLSYTDPKTGEFQGVIADLFAAITADTGLRFRFIAADNQQTALRMTQSNDINVLCGTTGDYLDNERNGLYATQTYLRAHAVLISKGTTERIRKIATLYGYQNGDALLAGGENRLLQFFNSPEECFEAVRKGEADAACVNSYVAEQLLADRRYRSFQKTSLTNNLEEIAIGVSRGMDPLLLSILDKCIQYVSSEEMDGILLKHTVAPIAPSPPRVQPLILMGSALVIIGLLVFLFVFKNSSARRIAGLLYRDELTGLWNLNKFRIEAAKALKTAETGTRAIVYADIKQFHVLNDALGFAEGDGILRAMAQILEDALLPGELCARVSADNFVLLIRYKTWEKLEERVAGIDNALNAWATQLEKSYRLILVFGVYIVEKEQKLDVSLMLDLANHARRRGINTHKTHAVLYDAAMRMEDLQQRRLADRMQAALSRGEFVVYYQPKIDMITGELVGSEALVRWNDPAQGLLSPGQFIPYFEKNGFVLEIDYTVFEQACKALRHWMDEEIIVCPISCNFSRAHFADPLFVGKLIAIAKRYGIPFQLLEVEVTESIFTEDFDQIREHFTKLRALGFSVSIDDFGAGYSSFSLLQQLRVDTIKLDRSVVERGTEDERGRIVIRGMVDIARELFMDVVCEGVESAGQVQMLKELGCRTAQGYYYAKPMSLDAFDTYMLSHQLY